jgi:hypothetical protein
VQAVDGEEHGVALGGRGAGLTVWDLATQQCTFAAKEARPNALGLVDLPWVSALATLPTASGQCLHMMHGGTSEQVARSQALG